MGGLVARQCSIARHRRRSGRSRGRRAAGFRCRSRAALRGGAGFRPLRRAEHAFAQRRHARDAALRELALHARGLVVAVDEHRDVAGLDAPRCAVARTCSGARRAPIDLARRCVSGAARARCPSSSAADRARRRCAKIEQMQRRRDAVAVGEIGVGDLAARPHDGISAFRRPRTDARRLRRTLRRPPRSCAGASGNCDRASRSIRRRPRRRGTCARRRRGSGRSPAWDRRSGTVPASRRRRARRRCGGTHPTASRRCPGTRRRARPGIRGAARSPDARLVSTRAPRARARRDRRSR